MVSYKDVKLSDDTFSCGLTLLTGKQIKEVRGYFADIGSNTICFKLCEIEFTDGSRVDVEGEHDFPYALMYAHYPQPNLDDETLERLYQEQENKDDEP